MRRLRRIILKAIKGIAKELSEEEDEDMVEQHLNDLKLAHWMLSVEKNGELKEKTERTYTHEVDGSFADNVMLSNDTKVPSAIYTTVHNLLTTQDKIKNSDVLEKLQSDHQKINYAVDTLRTYISAAFRAMVEAGELEKAEGWGYYKLKGHTQANGKSINDYYQEDRQLMKDLVGGIQHG